MHQDIYQPVTASVAPNLQDLFNKPAPARAPNASAVLDELGHELTGATREAAELLGQAAQASALFRGDPIAILDQAIEVAPHFTMAILFKAYLCFLSTEPDANGHALKLLAQVSTLDASDRERSHMQALEHACNGHWNDAAIHLDYHNMRYPHDLMAIQIGHLLDFFRGNARNLRDRIARILPAWSASMPGYSLVLGMHAFGLEETGQYPQAEDFGRQALEMQPLDSWAHHAVAHVMEMQNRASDGLHWMSSREEHWSGPENFFQVHNWWHRALFHLELGEHAEALALYDGPIRGTNSHVAADMIDASAMLWRLHLCGIDVGQRWTELANAWDAHADGGHYPFNDWHAVMAYLGAGQHAKVDRLLFKLSHGDLGRDNGRWSAQIGVPLVTGFQAFWNQNYEKAIQCLHGARFNASSFGGSHAQRDVIDWTLIEAAVRNETPAIAQALAAERLSYKPQSAINRHWRDRAAKQS